MNYLNEILRVRVHFRHNVAPVLGGCRPEIAPQYTRILRPFVFGWSSNDVENLHQLIHLIKAVKQGLPEIEFSKDAAAGPNVDWSCIRQTHQDFWTSIP